MGFAEFLGNTETVTQMRRMLQRDRFPHAVILTGARGSGKYMLAQMVAKAMNCESPIETDGLPDFCGHCSQCERIGVNDDLDKRFAEAVEARDALKDSEKRETNIIVQNHPDVMVLPPDPPQLLVKVGQVRHLIASVYYQPQAGRRKVYIFSDASFMKEAANAILKVLEEPPNFATIFLLAENATQLLPTIRSRCIQLRLTPQEPEMIEKLLTRRIDWTAAQRQLAARLCEGAAGRAMRFDLAGYINSRKDALTLIKTGLGETSDHEALFRATETYRAGGDGKIRTDALFDALHLLLEDLLYIQSNRGDKIRNCDILDELQRLAESVDFDWIAAASERISATQTAQRRNVLRPLALEALSASFER